MTTTPPRVSVVMPSAHAKAFVEDALTSIHTQTFRDFELIYRPDPLRVGPATTLNKGFALASGTDYWTWVSDDNVMHPDWLETLVAYLDAHPEAGAVYSSYRHEPGVMTPQGWRPHRNRTRILRKPPAPLVDSLNCYVGPSFLYRAHLHHEHRGAISHDYRWWLELEEKAAIHWLDRLLCTYRWHADRAGATLRHTFDAPQAREEAIARRSAR